MNAKRAHIAMVMWTCVLAGDLWVAVMTSSMRLKTSLVGAGRPVGWAFSIDPPI